MQASFTLLIQNTFLVITTILKQLLILNILRRWRLIHLIIVVALLNFDIYRYSRWSNKWLVLSLRKLGDQTAQSSFSLFLRSIPVILILTRQTVILYIYSFISICVPVFSTFLLLVVSKLVFQYSILLILMIFSGSVVFVLVLRG